jgi:hypothetical protein
MTVTSLVGENPAMDLTETEAHLRSMLEQAGVDLKQPDPLTTWTVFTKFGAKEIDRIQPDDDGFLFQWGVHGSSQLFHLGFLRQFSFFTADGEYDHMEQLQCTFHYEPTAELRALGSGDDWWFRSEPRRTLDSWVTEIEALPAFDVLRRRLRPVESFIKQGRI